MENKKLIVDIGNTSTKILVFDGDEILVAERCENNSNQILTALNKLFETYASCSGILSTVLSEDQALNALLKNKTTHFIQLSNETELPISIVYETPKTLGNDRIAGVAGAHNIFPKDNVLVVDIGTAITYDFIDAQGQYLGGNIAPGIRLRFESLHYFTSKLPLVSASETYSAIGTSTETAIRSGVLMGILYEIEGYIHHYQSKYSSLKVILTGGDAFYFVEKLKNTIFAVPNLVPIGLNSILSYYNEKIV